MSRLGSAWVKTDWQVELSPELALRLQNVARRRGQPAEQLIQRAVDIFIQAVEEEPPGPAMLSAAQARRAADHAVFGDLVGLALNSGPPTWQSAPEPHWRVPYRALTGGLRLEVTVDALTGAVHLTDEERSHFLQELETIAVESHEAT